MRVPTLLLLLALLPALVLSSDNCDSCYLPKHNTDCPSSDVGGQEAYTLHMSVHPHLDAYWIFNFSSYYDPQPRQAEVRGYFAANRFSSVKDILNTALH